jgi:hypothetical protein
MPILGLGLHVIIAIFFAIHVIRSGQPMYWLFVLFSFPLLGSIVYFVAVFLPASKMERGARRAISAAVSIVDPNREVRDARQAFDDAPTAQNQMRLAAALLEVGQAQAAAEQYAACLKGPFSTDPDIRIGAARAYIECQRYADGQAHLEPLRAERPEFRREAVSLLIARAYAGLGRQAEARVEFEAAANRFNTYEAKAEYAIWCFSQKDLSTANQLMLELEKISGKWNAMTRDMNIHIQRRLNAARDLAK